MHKQLTKFGMAAVLGLGMVMSVAQAQDQAPPPPAGARQGRQMMDPEQQVQRMRQQLKLSDDQVSQIRPILMDAQKQSMDVRSDSSLAQDDRRAKMMSIRQDAMQKVRALLTDDQKAMMAQMMQQRRQNRTAGPGNDAPPNQ